ncbi:hypothetical protein HDU97_002761 [Phlyctochytrium planicorne]|nr:hypothetical protein HDU97_002761 [Phlyctochytrium planicorne]
MELLSGAGVATVTQGVYAKNHGHNTNQPNNITTKPSNTFNSSPTDSNQTLSSAFASTTIDADDPDHAPTSNPSTTLDPIINQLFQNRSTMSDVDEEAEKERRNRMYIMLRYSHHYKRLQVESANTRWAAAASGDLIGVDELNVGGNGGDAATTSDGNGAGAATAAGGIHHDKGGTMDLFKGLPSSPSIDAVASIPLFPSSMPSGLLSGLDSHENKPDREWKLGRQPATSSSVPSGSVMMGVGDFYDEDGRSSENSRASHFSLSGLNPQPPLPVISSVAQQHPSRSKPDDASHHQHMQQQQHQELGRTKSRIHHTNFNHQNSIDISSDNDIPKRTYTTQSNIIVTDNSMQPTPPTDAAVIKGMRRVSFSTNVTLINERRKNALKQSMSSLRNQSQQHQPSLTSISTTATSTSTVSSPASSQKILADSLSDGGGRSSSTQLSSSLESTGLSLSGSLPEIKAPVEALPKVSGGGGVASLPLGGSKESGSRSEGASTTSSSTSSTSSSASASAAVGPSPSQSSGGSGASGASKASRSTVRSMSISLSSLHSRTVSGSSSPHMMPCHLHLQQQQQKQEHQQKVLRHHQRRNCEIRGSTSSSSFCEEACPAQKLRGAGHGILLMAQNLFGSLLRRRREEEGSGMKNGGANDLRNGPDRRGVAEKGEKGEKRERRDRRSKGSVGRRGDYEQQQQQRRGGKEEEGNDNGCGDDSRGKGAGGGRGGILNRQIKMMMGGLNVRSSSERKTGGGGGGGGGG